MRSPIVVVLCILSFGWKPSLGFSSTFVRPLRKQQQQSNSNCRHSKGRLFMKTIAVIGASGRTATECIYQALKDGDTVVGLTRNPDNVKVPKGSGKDEVGQSMLNNPNLTVIGGDVTNPKDVAKVFDSSSAESFDGVIVALGGSTSDVGKTMLTDGTTNIVNAMKERNIRRIAVVTSIGAGDSINQAPLAFRILMMTVMKSMFNDKNEQERVVQNSGLDFCIVRPGGLTEDAPTGIINVIDGQAGSIARADVASFCLDAVRVDDNDFPYIGKTPCISSVGGTSWTKDRSTVAGGRA